MKNPQSSPSHRAETAKTMVVQSWSVMTMATGMFALALTVAMFIGYRVGTDSTTEAVRAASAAAPAAAPAQPLVPTGGDVETDPITSVAGAPVAQEAPEPAKAEPVSAQRGALPPVTPPANRGMLHVPPVKVQIPAIDVESTLVELGLATDNSLQVPEDASKAGWYTGGAYPGDVNGPPALIVGHVDDQEGPAIFYALDQLRVGDEVRVQRTDGSTAVFVVYDFEQYPKSALPTDEVYRDRKESEVVLITCTGDFDVDANSYLDNYVVTARLDPMLTKKAAQG